MCLIVFEWRPDAVKGAMLTLAANRDEYFLRESAPLGWWADRSGVLAGRDLVGGGTWLGLSGLFGLLGLSGLPGLLGLLGLFGVAGVIAVLSGVPRGVL